MGVYKEGKNWKVQVYYKDWQGNRKRKQKRGFRTKGEAKEWERDFLQQQSQGVDIEFGNFLEIYYKDMDVRLRENTMYTKRWNAVIYGSYGNKNAAGRRSYCSIYHGKSFYVGRTDK